MQFVRRHYSVFFWQFSLPAQRAYRHTARQRIASDITLTNHATRTCFSAPIHANNGLICRLVTIAYVDPAYCRCCRKLITALDCVCPCSWIFHFTREMRNISSPDLKSAIAVDSNPDWKIVNFWWWFLLHFRWYLAVYSLCMHPYIYQFQVEFQFLTPDWIQHIRFPTGQECFNDWKVFAVRPKNAMHF